MILCVGPLMFGQTAVGSCWASSFVKHFTAKKVA